MIVGDFKAGHTLCRYPGDTGKGRRLVPFALETSVILINDSSVFTRIGTRGQVGTNPDLTFVKHAQTAAWSNTGETLGSDHCTVHMELSNSSKHRRESRHSITNWNKFREIQRAQLSEAAVGDISAWPRQMLETVEQCTEHLDPDDLLDASDVDSRLLHT